MNEVVENFRSYLVVNKVPNRLLGSFDVNPIITRIQQVTKTWLAKEVTYLGSISFQPEVENSMIDLVPVVVKYPRGKMAEELILLWKSSLIRRCRQGFSSDSLSSPNSHLFLRQPLLKSQGTYCKYDDTQNEERSNLGPENINPDAF